MILQSMRWYLAYALSYRDIEKMMAERGFSVDHSTINRWVLHYSMVKKLIQPVGLEFVIRDPQGLSYRLHG